MEMTSPTQHSETPAAPLPTDSEIVEMIATHLMGWEHLTWEEIQRITCPPRHGAFYMIQHIVWYFGPPEGEEFADNWQFDPLFDEFACSVVLDRLAELFSQVCCDSWRYEGKAQYRVRAFHHIGPDYCIKGTCEGITPESRRRAIVLCAHAVAVQIALASGADVGKGEGEVING